MTGPIKIISISSAGIEIQPRQKSTDATTRHRHHEVTYSLLKMNGVSMENKSGEEYLIELVP